MYITHWGAINLTDTNLSQSWRVREREGCTWDVLCNRCKGFLWSWQEHVLVGVRQGLGGADALHSKRCKKWGTTLDGWSVSRTGLHTHNITELTESFLASFRWKKEEEKMGWSWVKDDRKMRQVAWMASSSKKNKKRRQNGCYLYCQAGSGYKVDLWFVPYSVPDW